MKTAPSEDDAERCFSEKFSKRVSTLPPAFTWKGSGEYEAADRRQCRHDSWGVIDGY